MYNKENNNNWGEDFSQQDFEFKKEFWEEAEEILDKDQKQSRLKKIAMVSSVLLFLSLWTWWANEKIAFVETNRELSYLPQITDTSDQLRPEKYRFESVKVQIPFPVDEFKNKSLFSSIVNGNNIVKKARNNKTISSKTKADYSVKGRKSTTDNLSKNKVEQSNSDLIKVGQITPNEINTTSHSQLISIELPELKKPYLKPKRRTRWSLEGQTGLNIMKDQAVNQWDQNFGIAIYYKVVSRPKFSVDVGAGFKSLQLHGLDSSFTNKTYDFGSKSRITDVAYNRNFYLYMPVKLNLHHKKHTFGAGMNLGYRVSTETSLETRKIEYKTQKSNIEQTIDRNYGIQEGVHALLIEASLSYHYSLSEHIDMGLNVNAGLNDITENNFWNNNDKTQFLSGNISLRYHITTR